MLVLLFGVCIKGGRDEEYGSSTAGLEKSSLTQSWQVDLLVGQADI